MLHVSKIQWWSRHRIEIPIPKGKTRKEKGVTGPEQDQNLKAHWGEECCLLDLPGQGFHFLDTLR